MSELPKGWAIAELGEIASVDWGNTTITKKSYVEHGYLAFSAAGPDGRLSEYENECEAIVLSAIGAGCGKCFRAAGKWTAIKNTITIKPEPEISNSYLFRFLNNPKSWEISGSGQPFITLGSGRKTAIPFPPAAEQTRIAAKLDELLAQVDTLKARIDGIPALLKRFRQSVLAAAVSGRLTAEWRKVNEGTPTTVSWPDVQAIPPAFEIPNSWSGVSLGSICERVSVGHVGKTSEFYVSDGEGVPFLRSQNVRPGNISLKGLAYVSRQFHAKLKKSQLMEGDLLVVRVGANRGDACTLPRIFEQANCANIVFARPPREISPYLNIYFQSPVVRELLIDETVGGAQGVINTSSVSAIFLALPTKEEQTEIVRRVEQLFAFADQLEVKVNEAKARIDRLTQSILAKAFRGELVPQDPDDEPASVLLERIQARRAAASKAKRGRRKAEHA